MQPHSFVSLLVTFALLAAPAEPALAAGQCVALSQTSSSINGTFAGCETYSLWKVVDLDAAGITDLFTVRSVDVGIFHATGVSQITVRLYAQTGAAFPGGTRRLVGTITSSVEPGHAFVSNVPVVGTVPRGSDLVVEVERPAPGIGQVDLGLSSQSPGTTYVSSPSCIVGPTPRPLPSSLVLTVNGCSGLLAQTLYTSGPLLPYSCLDGGFNGEYDVLRAFDLPALGIDDPVNVTRVNVGIAEANAGGTATSQPLVVSLHAYDAPGLPADLGPPVSMREVTIADQGAGVLSIPITGTIRRGAKLAVKIHVPSGVAAQNYLAFGRTSTGEVAPAYVGSIQCTGSPEPVGLPLPGLVIDVVASTTSLSQHTDLPVDGGSACERDFTLQEDSFFRAFDLPALGVTVPYVVESVDAGVGFVRASSPTATQRLRANVYANSGGAFPAGTRTLVGTGTAIVRDTALTTINVPVHAVVPAGSELVVEVSQLTDHPFMALFSLGSNSGPQTAPTYVLAPACSGPNVIVLPGTSFVLTVNGAADASAVVGHGDGVGLFATTTNAAFLRDEPASGPADVVFTYGSTPAVAVAGDWDGDGTDSLGLYVAQSGAFFLKNSNGPGPADLVFTFGPATGGVVPLAGDWDGDGVDTIGLYVPATGAFFLKNSNSGGAADVVFTFGAAGGGSIPVVGDWDGDGTDTIGLYVPATGAFFLKNSNGGGAAELFFTFGGVGPLPVSGDWNGDGVDTIGIYVPETGVFFLKNTNAGGNADLFFTFGGGGPDIQPLVGDWDGS